MLPQKTTAFVSLIEFSFSSPLGSAEFENGNPIEESKAVFFWLSMFLTYQLECKNERPKGGPETDECIVESEISIFSLQNS